MKEDLVKLYNTLKLINTKGEDTKIMAKCLEFTEELIRDADRPAAIPAPAQASEE